MQSSYYIPRRAVAFPIGLLALVLTFVGCNDNPVGAADAATSAGDLSNAALRVEGATGAVIPFADAEAFFEFNTTDNDLGLQIFLDAEGWERVGVADPTGDRIVEFEAKGNLSDLGITELRFESAEPSPEEVLSRFPPGDYRFRGETVEGDKLVGSSELSHYFAPAPTISPSGGALVDPENVVVEWDAPDAELVEIIIESDDSDAIFDVIVEGDNTSLTVPPEFLEEGTEYKIEILSYAENGNRTIVESTFVTM